MESVVTDLGMGQRQCYALGIGCAHVLADVCDLGWITCVRLEVGGEVHHAVVVASLAGKQELLGIEVVHHGAAALPLAQAGLVDTHDAHPGHVLLHPCKVAMRRHSCLSEQRSNAAAWRTGSVWHNDKARASNKAVKPLPSRAQGTPICVVLPQAVQAMRGTWACSQASY